MSSSQELQQCIAITEEGERCSRPARDGSFCYQHSEENETIEDPEEMEENESGDAQEAEDEQSADHEGGDQETEEQAEQPEREQQMESGDDAEREQQMDAEGDESGGIQITARSEQQTEESEDDMASPERDVAESDITSIRENVSNVASDIVGYPLDGIASISADEEGWEVAIEVVERSGIPDTQDIIGRYELRFDSDLEVQGYRRTHRYRRDDMEHDI